MNWLTPLAEARDTGPTGSGSFATAPIPAGTTVAAFGGYVAARQVMGSLPADRQNRSIQIDDELFLVSSVDPEPGDMVNHSCDPSCGLRGEIVVVAMRDLEPGEEQRARRGDLACAAHELGSRELQVGAAGVRRRGRHRHRDR